jgi:hypothetical protein
MFVWTVNGVMTVIVFGGFIIGVGTFLFLTRKR